MKKVIIATLSSVLLTACVSAKGMDPNNEKEMKTLGILEACTYYFEDQDQLLKHAILNIALQDELDNNWNLYKNEVYKNTAAESYFDLLKWGKESVNYSRCIKLYDAISHVLESTEKN